MRSSAVLGLFLFNAVVRGQLVPPITSPTLSVPVVAPPTTSSTPPPTSSPPPSSTPPTSSVAPSTSAPSDTASSAPPPSSPATSQPSTAPPPVTSQAPTNQPDATLGGGTSTVVELTTNSEGSTIPATPSSTTPAQPSNDSEKTSVGTGTVVGLSVAGGIAVLGIIAFIIWKLTRKRFSDFDAGGEEIKWPELNNETHALPTNPTGRVGIDDDGFDEAGVVAGHRGPSPYGAAASSAGASMTDMNPSYHDPYAVPPLPHLDPNQPYRDDPASAGNYYDPYRGPVPQSLHDGHDGAESIPMSTYSSSSGGGHYSQGHYSGGAQSPDQGRRSPGPALAYGGRQSPGPAAAFDGAYRS